jgi:hypothetical protein
MLVVGRVDPHRDDGLVGEGDRHANGAKADVGADDRTNLRSVVVVDFDYLTVADGVGDFGVGDVPLVLAFADVMVVETTPDPDALDEVLNGVGFKAAHLDAVFALVGLSGGRHVNRILSRSQFWPLFLELFFQIKRGALCGSLF